MDPDGQKPIKSNWFLGIYAHKAIQAHFMATMFFQGETYIEVNAFPYGRADLALERRDLVECWEIKPSSYNDKGYKSRKANDQLEGYLKGLRLRFQKPVEKGTSYKPDGTRIPFPGWEGAYITITTDPEQPGMVYYEIDDGLPEGTKTKVPNYSLLKEALKGGLDVLVDVIEKMYPPKTDPLVVPPPPPLIPVPVF